MGHPTEGTLRRLLDEPAGVADTDREHVAGCPQCLDGLASMQEDAALVGAALATGRAPAVDVEAAWARLTAAAPDSPPARAVAPARAFRWRGVLRRPSVAAIGVAVVLTGAGTAAANDWLHIFRTKQIAPVSVSTSDLVTLPDLRAYGDVVVTSPVDVNAVPDAATATAQTGLNVPEVSNLPRGVSGAPVYQAGGPLRGEGEGGAGPTAPRPGRQPGAAGRRPGRGRRLAAADRGACPLRGSGRGAHRLLVRRPLRHGA